MAKALTPSYPNSPILINRPRLRAVESTASVSTRDYVNHSIFSQTLYQYNAPLRGKVEFASIGKL